MEIVIHQIKNKTLKEDGQSTIEFLMSFAIVFGFIFSFLKLAIVYTNGYLVHYLTFQASRAYMVTETGSNSPAGSDGAAKAEAIKVFDSYGITTLLPNFEGTPEIEDPETNAGNAKNLYVGVRVEFSEFINIPGTNRKITFPLISESYLGREPTQAEC
ncbi:MAG: hypothetical protein NXH75_10260, partial [Halobacteriovoraceae bacterium]|nr:hypothetical protein [Halobacteriovoraceae bacterium]